ncbi:MAG TPA: ABC transporter ATP-binding protein [Solirubrobacteraceae bacterium]
MALRSLYVEPEAPAHEVKPPALQFHDVFRIYRSGPVETVALRGLELAIEQGELVAVLGPSGCGKSTMLNLASGLDTPSAGEVRFFGRSFAVMDEDALAAVRAREIALVLQRENLWPALSAQENVVASLRLAGQRRPAAAAAQALAELGLGDRGRHHIGSLSGGEQQRVAIAAAAARRAALVLADEPTGELDRANEAAVLDALERLRAEHGSTVVVVTHSEAVAGRADRVIEMRDGRVIA